MKPLTPKFPKLLHGGDYNPEQWLRYPEILKQDVELMKKADIKRFLALYFEASMNGEAMPDVDGEQFYEVDNDENSED